MSLAFDKEIIIAWTHMEDVAVSPITSGEGDP
jgi:hypothetical protein